MSESENEKINELTKLIRKVNDISFLHSLNRFIEDRDNEPSDDSSDMKHHIIMELKTIKNTTHISAIISKRINKLNRTSSQRGGSRRKLRKNHRKTRRS